jgi:ABC-type phosphate transport system substrate-binding protein
MFRLVLIRFIFLFILLLFGISIAFSHESLAVITQSNSDLQNLPIAHIKRIYLRKTILDSQGNRWQPVNMPISSELRQKFSAAIFNQKPEDQEEYWNQQYYQGIMPPAVLTSDEAILRFVAITPGAIGYVRRESVDDRVKVVSFISLPDAPIH